MKLITLTTVTIFLLCLASVPNGVLASTTEAVTLCTSTPAPITENSIECGKNEEPTDCVSCNPTCKELSPGICHGPKCKPGCKCKTGYFKDSEGNCVSVLGCIMDNIQIELSQWELSTVTAQE
ncbi:venom peptide BmKAPI-like [Osmia bicornis bicornis]|uniref:venom peptide BmKAPI-like n=1 Tax=Osmia bicornis bicornis TaxID=1437191 RepID=UPI001EAF4425|nr:venom peptide BmKAPI-like [Osmia bicornis bicornis]